MKIIIWSDLLGSEQSGIAEMMNTLDNGISITLNARMGINEVQNQGGMWGRAICSQLFQRGGSVEEAESDNVLDTTMDGLDITMTGTGISKEPNGTRPYCIYFGLLLRLAWARSVMSRRRSGHSSSGDFWEAGGTCRKVLGERLGDVKKMNRGTLYFAWMGKIVSLSILDSREEFNSVSSHECLPRCPL